MLLFLLLFFPKFRLQLSRTVCLELRLSSAAHLWMKSTFGVIRFVGLGVLGLFFLVYNRVIKRNGCNL